MSLRLSGTWFFGLVSLAACGGAPSSGFDVLGPDGSVATADGAPGTVSGDSGSPGQLSTPDGAVLGAGDSSISTDCPESAKLVYVTGEGSQLWSFYPPTLKFTLIGTMTCLQSPTHMTVDRQGSAWVVSNGTLYKASTSDASCAAVSTWTPQPENFDDFALTFLGTTSATDNTLYMLGTDSGVLGKFDVVSGVVTNIGSPQIQSTAGDMTTNGDGTLYFLLDQFQLQLYELNPANAAVMKTYSPDAMGGGDQALAYYGGSFYAFEDDVINQFDPTTNTTMALGNAPLSITGAGQSTCVPTIAPPPP